jgi:hypothetical protein
MIAIEFDGKIEGVFHSHIEILGVFNPIPVSHQSINEHSSRAVSVWGALLTLWLLIVPYFEDFSLFTL